MPTIDENKEAWDRSYAWPRGGDEWSEPWGGVEMQWHGMLMPRLHAFLPAPTILEIAPGFGRMTRFLKDHCERLILVDLSARCIDACRRRFAACSHITYHVNDGTSLEMVDDDSVDLVFSFDSLVHVDGPTIAAYLGQLPRKLTAEGAVFLHHSNLGESWGRGILQRAPLLGRRVRRRQVAEQARHCRSPDMTAAGMETLARDSGLRCIAQEIIPWGASRDLIDCFSVMVREGSRRCRENRILRNTAFMRDAAHLARLARLYRPDGE